MLNEMAGLGSQWQIKGEFLVSELDYLDYFFVHHWFYTQNIISTMTGVYTQCNSKS